MGEWTECRIGKVVSLQQGLCINSKSKHLLANEGHTLLRITDLINKSKVQFINKDKVRDKFIATKKDLIYTRTGQVGLIFKGREGVVHNNCFTIKPSDEVDSNYLYWFLKTSFAYDYANSVASGAAQLDLGHSPFNSMYIRYPVKSTQKKIAAILSAYDDLIENNKRRIALLEKMAEEIYREWFVRFRFPGYQTAEFEKGIPKGWNEIEIKGVVDFKSGFAFKSKNYEANAEYGIVTIKNVHDGRFITECSDHIPQPPNSLSEHCFINNGDILMSLTGNVGRVCIAHGKKLLMNQRVVLLKPKQNKQSYFIYWLFRQKSMLTFCEMISTGAAQQNLSPIKLGVQKIIYPDSRVIERYQDTVEPIMSKVMTLLEKNKILTTTKNMLLPRLISGKLSVEDLDIQFPPSMMDEVEEVVSG